MAQIGAARIVSTDRLKALLLPLEPTYPIDSEAGSARLRQVLLDPVYQLK